MILSKMDGKFERAFFRLASGSCLTNYGYCILARIVVMVLQEHAQWEIRLMSAH